VQLGRVIGTVVSTQKNRKLEGAKLLLVQLLGPDDRPRGASILAIDSVGAGIGERVLVVIEGKAAGDALRRKAAPVDAAVIGIVDVVDCDDAAALTQPAEPAETTKDARRRAPRARS
jgi:ethanolamine utilization protein EutN